MTGLEEKHSVISKEDMQSAMDFVEDFSHELEKYPHRIAASKDETACAKSNPQSLARRNGRKNSSRSI